MSNKEPITVEGLKKLSEELVFLKEKKIIEKKVSCNS